MATISRLGHIWNTTAGDKTVTATPAVGDLICVVTGYSGSASPENMSDDNADGYGGTASNPVGYSVVVQQAVGGPRIYVRNAFIGSATSTNFLMTQTGTTGGGGIVYKVTGMLRTGGPAVRQYVAGSVAAAGTPALTFGAAVLTANSLLGLLVNGSNPAAVTPPSGWTEDPTPDLGYATPTKGIEGIFRNTGETGTTITWGSTSATSGALCLAELDITAPPPHFAMNPVPYIQNVNHLSPI